MGKGTGFVLLIIGLVFIYFAVTSISGPFDEFPGLSQTWLYIIGIIFIIIGLYYLFKRGPPNLRNYYPR